MIDSLKFEEINYRLYLYQFLICLIIKSTVKITSFNYIIISTLALRVCQWSSYGFPNERIFGVDVQLGKKERTGATDQVFQGLCTG